MVLDNTAVLPVEERFPVSSGINHANEIDSNTITNSQVIIYSSIPHTLTTPPVLNINYTLIVISYITILKGYEIYHVTITCIYFNN